MWHWLDTSLKKDLVEVSDREFLLNQGIFNPDYIEKNFKTLGRVNVQVIWDFLMFQLWYKMYMI